MRVTYYICEAHGSKVKAEQTEEWCVECEVELVEPIPEDSEGRATDLEKWMTRRVTFPFTLLHERIDKLVGRPTYTHELAYPEYLVHEIRTGLRPSMDGIIAKFPHKMKVITVELPKGETP